MPKSRHKKKRKGSYTLVGSWVSGTEYGSEIEYIVTPHGDTFKVRAIDQFDGEVADVFEVKWDGQILSFATHWNSTGRFMRCRLEAIAKNEASYTYTYTTNETWHRKSAS